MAASAVAAALLLALPAGASAARWSGVVVEKDAERGTVSTATRSGEVRTVRLPARALERARVAQRVTVRAAARADGTYEATRLAARGRSTRSTVRGAVVKARGRQLYISAGESVLAVRTASSRRVRAASVDGVGAGDLVIADVTLGSHGIRATDVRDVGDVALLELEGIVLDLSDGVLRLAVARRGEVQVIVPDDVLTSAPAAGDQVEIAVSVADDGSFTLVALELEDDGDGDDHDHGLSVDEEDGEVKAEGVIAALSAESIGVRVGGQTVTCDVPAGADLSAFAVGDEVEAKCELVDGALVLRKLESEDVEFKVTDDGTFKLEVEGDGHDAADDEDDDERDGDDDHEDDGADDDDEETDDETDDD